MPEPTKIPRPFADSGDKNSIPDSSGSIGFASWQEGFPAITSEPFASGGVAPKRADFNGIFNALSLATVWQQQGGFYAYDNSTDYEVGNVVEYSGDLYKCITANGPSSTVKAPTDTTVWSKVMTAADVAAAYLPLSGGTMTGNITFSGASPAIVVATTDSYIRINNSSYNGGASMYLNGKDRSTDTGTFSLIAYDGANRKVFAGGPDGTLTWDGKDVATYETGTWTPTLYGSSTAGTITNTANSSFYIKIGRLVFLRFQFSWKIEAAPTGDVMISGVPYTFDSFYPGFAGSNSHICNIAQSTGENVTTFRLRSYTPSTSQLSNITWGSSNSYNVWNNAVNSTDTTLGWLLYRTKA